MEEKLNNSLWRIWLNAHWHYSALARSHIKSKCKLSVLPYIFICKWHNNCFGMLNLCTYVPSFNVNWCNCAKQHDDYIRWSVAIHIVFNFFLLFTSLAFAPVWQSAMKVHAFLCIFNTRTYMYIILNISLFLKFMIYAGLLCLCSVYMAYTTDMYLFFRFIPYMLLAV